MGIIGRQTIKSTIYIYLGVVIGFFVRAHFFPEYLTPSEIGIIALLVSYGSIFAQVAMLGFDHATIRYFPYFRKKSRSHKGFLSLYLLVALAGFIITFLIYRLVGMWSIDPQSDLSLYYYLSLPLTAGLLLFNVLDKYNTVLYNASTGVLLSQFLQRVLILVVLLPLIFGMIDFDLFASLYVTTFLLTALLMMAFVIWRDEFHLDFSFRSVEPQLIRAMAGISTFGFVTGLTNVLNLQVNNILIDWYYDEAQTGIYITNFFFATLILLPSRGLNKIAPTMISDAFKENRIDQIANIQFKSTINQQLIGVLIFIGLYINLPNVYQILPESYAVGSGVIIYTGLANVIQMTAGVSNAIIGFSAHYRYNTYLVILQLLLLVLLNLILLPILGITGAAVATFISILILNLIRFVILKVKFQIQPYQKRHLWVFGTGILCLGINELIPSFDQYLLDIVVRSSAITASFVLSNYFLKTSYQLNDTLNKALGVLRIR